MSAGKRPGRAGHRGRKQITQHHIARPVVAAARRAVKEKRLDEHLESLTPWETQTLYAARSGIARARR